MLGKIGLVGARLFHYEYAIELFPEGLEILVLHTIKSLSLPEDYILTTSIEH